MEKRYSLLFQTTRCVSVLVLASALFMLSCGRGPPRLNPVHGKIVYQGKPLAGAVVSLHPEGNNLRERSIGKSAEDGSFTLMTGSAIGAPTGKYAVTIICPTPVQGSATQGLSMGGPPETEDRLKGAYASREKSRLVVEIAEGANKLPPFELE